MLIEKLDVGASGLAKLVAEGTTLFVRLEFWEALGHDEGRLACGVELGEEELVDLVLAAKATEAEARGASLLGRAEQPRFLLRSKLVERGYPTQAVEVALDRLEAEGFLSDRRYAETWLRARVDHAIRAGESSATRGGKAEGPGSLLLSLRARSVSESDAKAALAEVLDLETRAALLGAAISTLSRRGERSGPQGRWDGLRDALRELGWKGEELREALDRGGEGGEA